MTLRKHQRNPGQIAPVLHAPDWNAVSMLHFNGADASTTFTDDTGKVWTPFGSAQIDTAQKQFGTASGLFNGTTDYITTPDSPDWRLDAGTVTGPWTIDFWLRYNVDPGPAGISGIIQQYQANTDFWGFFLTSNVLRFICYSGGVAIITVDKAFDPAASTWYHIALVKTDAGDYMTFVNGTQIGTTVNDNLHVMPDFAGVLQVGKIINSAGTSYFLNGWVDEVRVSKGIARWTANFTPPSAEYIIT